MARAGERGKITHTIVTNAGYVAKAHFRLELLPPNRPSSLYATTTGFDRERVRVTIEHENYRKNEYRV